MNPNKIQEAEIISEELTATTTLAVNVPSELAEEKYERAKGEVKKHKNRQILSKEVVFQEL